MTVHDYQSLNLDVVKAIVTERLDAVRAFARRALEVAGRPGPAGVSPFGPRSGYQMLPLRPRSGRQRSTA